MKQNWREKKVLAPLHLQIVNKIFAFKFNTMDFIINESTLDSINEQHDNSETVDLSLPRSERFVDFEIILQLDDA